MDVKIIPSKLQGKMRPVSSKAEAHRALIISALANLKTEIEINNNSEEVRTTIACLKTLGAYFFTNEKSITVRPINKENIDLSVIDCFNSFATFKFLLPLIATLNKTVEITGERVLQKKNLEQYLYRLKGVGFTGEKMPFILSGKLSAGEYNIPTELGPQFISGLIIALATLNENSTINLLGEKVGLSQINSTNQLLLKFGVKIEERENGYFIRGGQEFVSPEKLTLLEDKTYNHYIELVNALSNDNEIGDINVKSNFDLLVCSAISASLNNGKTEISFSDKLLEKESERLSRLVSCMQKLGVNALLNDKLIINGTGQINGGAIVDVCKDASVAMGLTILCCYLKEESTLLGVESVLKNYPEFFNSLGGLGAKITAL